MMLFNDAIEAVQAFRDNALNPERPVIRGTAQNPDASSGQDRQVLPCSKSAKKLKICRMLWKRKR